MKNKFHNTFHPIWMDFMVNHSQSNPMDKKDINIVCEYIRLISNKIKLQTNHDKLKSMIKDLVNIYQPLTWPIVLMNEDKLSDVLKMMHPTFHEVANNVFGMDLNKKILSDLSKL